MSSRRSVLAGLLMLGLLAVAPAYAAPPEERVSGFSTFIGTHYGGKFRDALLYVSGTVPSLEPVPLVLVLHGLYQDAQTADAASGFEAIADSEKLAVVYPYGLDGSWNAGNCCGASSAKRVDDVGFLAHIVQLVSAVRPIDPTRVYIAGFSNGGMMALKAACARPDVFAAAASVAGTLQDSCAGDGPFSALFLHGTSDHTVPFQGMKYSKFLGTELTPVPRAATVVASRDRCQVRTASSLGRATRTLFSSCDAGTAVEIYAVAGMGHTWPRSDKQGVDGGRIVWDFLRVHSRAPR